MKIFAVRHGQSEYNVKELCDSDPSVKTPLTELGTKQAEEVALKLKDYKFDIVYTTELFRAQKTAEIINQYHNTKIVIDKRMNDRNSGFNGRPIYEYHDALKKEDDQWNAKFNDGESFEEEKIRIKSFLDELLKSEYKTILIVAHEEPIQIINGFINNLTNEEMIKVRVDNCSIFELDINLK